MTNDRLTEAANLLRQALEIVNDCNNIGNAIVQRGAIDAAKPHLDRVIDAAMAELAQA